MRLNSFLFHLTSFLSQWVILTLIVLSCSSTEAASPYQPSQLGQTVPVDPNAPSSILSLGTTSDFFGKDPLENIGISKMTDKVTAKSPIQKLATLSKKSGIGGRLVAVLGDAATNSALTPRSRMAIEGASNQLDNTAANVIVDTNIEANNEQLRQKTKMYTPRLSVNFQDFPTYQTDSNWQQSRTISMNNQLEKLNKSQINERIRLDYVDHVHVLRGTAPTDREKKIAEIMLRMEPGVAQIRNEIEVVPSSRETVLPPDRDPAPLPIDSLLHH